MMKPSRHEHEPQSDDSEATALLLARANLLLESLAREADAARLDAKRAELQLAMTEAKTGNAAPLARWIDHHQDYPNAIQNWRTSNATDLAAPILCSQSVMEARPPERLLTLHPPHLPDSSAGPAEATSTQIDGSEVAVNPWSGFMPHSRERLMARATEFKLVARGKESEREHGALKEVDRNATRNRNTATRTTKPTKIPSSVSRPTVLRPIVPRLSAAVIAKQFAQPDPEKVETRYRKIKRTLASGMGVSTIFHVLVVLALMIVTLKLPQPPASLAFEASPVEPVTETLEISQPAELSPAVEENVPEPTPISPSELDATLPSLNDPAIQRVMDQPTNSAAKSLTDALASSSSTSGAQAINKASASFFGAAAQGNSFCYVVDSSGSMRGGAWEAAKNELMRSLSSLKEKQRFYIIFFAQEFYAISELGQREPAAYALYANRENVDHARRWIDTIKIERGAPPNDALEFAISREPDAIYLLTDGVTKVDVCGFLRKVNRSVDIINGERARVPIHTIAFYSLDGQQLLRQIAAENQGQFIYVPDPRAK